MSRLQEKPLGAWKPNWVPPRTDVVRRSTLSGGWEPAAAPVHVGGGRGVGKASTMNDRRKLKRKLIAAERLLHNEGFLSESDRTRVWKRFDKAFTKGKWPASLRELSKLGTVLK